MRKNYQEKKTKKIVEEGDFEIKEIKENCDNPKKMKLKQLEMEQKIKEKKKELQGKFMKMKIMNLEL